MSESHPPQTLQLVLAPRPPHGHSREVEARALRPEEPGRVVVSDAFALLRSLPDESVDLVVTDPPYESLQLHRSRGTTTRLTTDWFVTVPNERLPELLREVFRVLRPDRHFYLFCDEVTADVIKLQQGIGPLRQPNGGRRCSSGFVYWKEIVWAKTTLDGTKIRPGTGYHYRASCERILFFEKGRRALSDLGVPDVLMAPRPQVRGPAVKPASVLRTLITQSTVEGELVVDPFAGSGVAGVEARGSGRRFLLGDLDLAYLDPSLAPFAPADAVVARTLQLAGETVEPREPPALETLADASATDEELEAARAAGLLDDEGASGELERLLAVRPVEREAALRRALRSDAPENDEPALLRSWRAWALNGRKT